VFGFEVDVAVDEKEVGSITFQHILREQVAGTRHYRTTTDTADMNRDTVLPSYLRKPGKGNCQLQGYLEVVGR